MSEKRRALGRGLGALIPSGPAGSRPVDVFFPGARVEPPLDTEADSADGAGHDRSDGAAHQAADVDEQQQRVDDVTPDDHEAFTGHAADDIANAGLAPVPGAYFAELPVDAIRPNPRQPRTTFDDDEMAELVHSISEIGVLQPVVVRAVPRPGSDSGEGAAYELIMGERRWRASQLAGNPTVPAIVKETQDDALLRDALLENLHRSQLNPLEEAAAYQQLLDDFGCTQEELAQRIGRSRPQVSNTLRLLRLPPAVARRVAAGVLTAGHARALLGLPDRAAMESLAQRIVAEGLSVRGVEEIVALGGDDTAPARRKPRPGGRHPQMDDIAARLSDRLDTRVGIALGQRKGKVTIEFASVEDLHRILGLVGLHQPS